jgi:[acyl-carrier-protein] S-malonyltransferase
MSNEQDAAKSSVTLTEMRELISVTGFAFRGFDQTNIGRTPELLAHPVYGCIVEKHLKAASEMTADLLKRPVDLVSRVRENRESTFEEYAETLSLIVSVELAQVEILRDVFQIDIQSSQLSIGYSLGEFAALITSGVYSLEAILSPPLILSDDIVALSEGVKMAIVFSRGNAMDLHLMERLCMEITACGRGTIAISSYLSPNTLLVLGQGNTVNELKQLVKERCGGGVSVRENPHRWPPIHTQITRQRNLPDRAAVMMERAAGGFTKPKPDIISCVTGSAGYTDINSRAILNRWVDEPQRLWDVVDQTIASGVMLLVHVGPNPNIIPSTMQRIRQNVQQQLAARTLSGIGLRAMSHIIRRHRPWMNTLMSSSATLLRTPFIREIILEDWLLETKPA